MRLIFLGTGGGRFVMANQLRRTAGFLVRTAETLIHVDPGPGAIVALKEKGISPGSIKGVIVSHAHLDHCNDAAVIVEGMTYGGKRKRGFFIGSEFAVNGGGDFLPALSRYHKNMLEHVVVARPGADVRVGDMRITFLSTKHDEPTGVGMILDDGKVSVAYLSDTGFVEETAKALKEMKPYAIIFNLIFDSEDDVPHTNTGAVFKFLSAYTPKLVLLQHFGARIILNRMQTALARRIEQEFGVETIPLNDGDILELPRKKKGIEVYFG